MRGLVAALAAVVFILVAPAAQADVQPYAANDAGGFHDVLPPGANGLANGIQLAAFLTTGQRPPHSDDQLAMYRDLMYATPGLKAEDLGRYYKDSTFGVKPGDVATTITPRAEVTIVRDASFGVPHIYGTTRGGTMFGAGYAAAQDRLFFIDVLRHLGRAELSSFIGGAPSNRAMDAEQWSIAPYTEADYQRQFDLGDDLYGDRGRRLQDDALNYVAGINQYIAEARLDPTKMPGEYVAIGRPQGPDDWKVTDLFATASLVGGIFGKGGGRELAEAQLLDAFQHRFGAKKGRTLWEQFAAFDDPDAPTTVKGTRFPYQTQAQEAHAWRGGAARPRLVQSARGVDLVDGAARDRRAAARGQPAAARRPGRAGGAVAARQPVAAGDAHAARRPGPARARPAAQGDVQRVARLGRQLGQRPPAGGLRPAGGLLRPADPHGGGPPRAGHRRQRRRLPGREPLRPARPRPRLRVERHLGRPGHHRHLCGAAVRRHALPLPRAVPGHREARSQERSGRRTWPTRRRPARRRCTPSARSSAWSPAGAPTRAARCSTRCCARPTSTRSTLPSASACSTSRATIRSPQDFQRAAGNIGYTFNWFYIDAKHIAYFNSGNNPVRAKGTTGQLPMASTKEWRDYNPDLNTARYTPFAQHPQVVDQPVLTSWNNRQAPGYAGADSNLFSSVFRSQMLDRQLALRLKGAHKLTLPEMVDAMEQAGTTDLRGMTSLPLALRILGKPKDPALAAAVARLKAWSASGTHRIDRNRDGTYDDADAVRIMDAWWPKLIQAMFLPVMGKGLLDRLEATYQIDNTPNNEGDHLGSAYQEGFYGYVLKDLKRVLKRPVAQKYAAAFCGRGRLAACRKALEASLKSALGEKATDTYPADDVCKAGDQACLDTVRFRPLGGVTQPLIPWINRPTYQQAVEVQGTAPR